MLPLLRKHSNHISVGYRRSHVGANMDHHIDTLNTLFNQAVNSVRPKALFETYLRGDSINNQLHIPNKRYHVIGFGKAVLGMAVQIERILGDRLSSGCISIPVGTLDRFKGDSDFQLNRSTRIDVIECARNNLPDTNALEAARKIKSFAEAMTDDDVLCVLVSGGGSALLPLPKHPVTLSEKLSVIKLLALAGATIEELNAVRIQLSDVKGGKLALAAKHSHKLLSFVISDIVGDPISLIASGPTVKASISNKEALRILEKYQLSDKIPHSVVEMLNNVDKELVDVPGNVHLIGSNKIAIDCLTSEASSLNHISVLPLTSCIEGNVESLSQKYIELIIYIRQLQGSFIQKSCFIEAVSVLGKSLHYDSEKATELAETIGNNFGKDLLLVSGGEPTVIVQGNGKGGRNQELALRFSQKCYQMEGLQDVLLLSAGTDGIDGPTDAAGAIGTADVVKQFSALASEKCIVDFIQENDSNTLYKLVGSGKYHIVTGHTGTNVMDIHMLYIPWKKE
ncbi:glycerate kinase-like [Armigeres subalbatus]|uniref:glycerate kinase-like n=1 Tax=Armigeres subalbatus TaxID=124917 RepID=UPI002ED67F15